MIIVSVHDLKAESFSSPVVSQNVATAIRDFATAVNQSGSLLNSHPDDFVLERLGEFDTRSGGISVDHAVLSSARDVFVSKD